MIAAMCQITIDVPDAAIGDASREDIAAEASMALAVRLFMTRRISQATACRMAGISRAEFIQRMGAYGGTDFTPENWALEEALPRA
jgi:hypothetical protein